MESQEVQHIVMFPFMAQGHIIPFLALARLIEQRTDHHCTTITLVNTPLNIRNLRPSLPPNTTIRLAELPFSSSDHNLPPDLENTDSLPSYLYTNFFLATETLQPSFEHLLSGLIHQHGRDRVCVIADMFLGWTVESAKELGIFHSVFVTSGAYGSAIFFSCWLHPPPTPTSSDEVALVDYPEITIHRSQLTNTLPSSDSMEPMSVFLRRQISLCFTSHGLLLNTVEEFEKTGLDLLHRIPGLPVWAIGPLVRPPSNHSIPIPITEFLDSHPPASVLFISFGSQSSIPASQMMDLATGLEASGKPFIWVVRPPAEFNVRDEFRDEWLPEGFEGRVLREKKQGLLVKGWAPQLEILSNPSTGGFLSHCGWNSVLESMNWGVPIIGWPLLGDQLYNSKMLEEMGVCVEVARGMMGGLESGWEGVERVVGLVMGGTEKGREMRRKAGKIREVLRGALREDGVVLGSSFKAVEDFIQTAFSMRK